MSKRSWDSCTMPQGRLIVQVMSAKGLGIDKPTELFVRIATADKKSFKDKTKTARKDINPVWNDIFYIDTCPPSLTFTIYAPDGMGEKFWGECTWYEKLQHTFKCPTDNLFDSCRSLTPPDAIEYHFEQKILKKMKTGDLILYSGTNMIHSMTKIENGSFFSSAGLVVELPNKWTSQLELFVLEPSENRSGVFDPFAESTAPGLNLFKLEDRLYNFHGSVIWLVPLVKPLEEEHVDIIRRWALQAHCVQSPVGSSTTNIKPFPAPDAKNPEMISWRPVEVLPERIKFLSDFYEKIKEESLFYSLYAPQMVGMALSEIGYVDSFSVDTSNWNIASVLASGCYKSTKMKILRAAQQSHSYLVTKPAQLDKAIKFHPRSSYEDISYRIPSEQSFVNQEKQIADLKNAIDAKITKEESNILKAASAELIRKKKPAKGAA